MTWSQYELSQIRVLSLCIHLLSLPRNPRFYLSSQTSLQILSQNKIKTYSFSLLLLGFSFKEYKKSNEQKIGTAKQGCRCGLLVHVVRKLLKLICGRHGLELQARKVLLYYKLGVVGHSALNAEGQNVKKTVGSGSLDHKDLE